MNEIEKTIINLDLSISDMNNKEKEKKDVYDNTVRSRKNAEEKLARYDRRFNKASNELRNMKIKRISYLMFPVAGCAVAACGALFSAPLSLTCALVVGSCGATYKYVSEVVNENCLSRKDERLLCALFPALRRKKAEIIKYSNDYEKQNERLNDLLISEEVALTEYNSVVSDLELLTSRSKELRDNYFKKIQRDYLPYYTDLEDVIAKTIKNPSQFYTNICNGLNHKERRDIISEIPSKTCDNCTNKSCQLSEEERTQNSDCKSWINEVEIGMSKVLRR